MVFKYTLRQYLLFRIFVSAVVCYIVSDALKKFILILIMLKFEKIGFKIFWLIKFLNLVVVN